tara:strand:- start:4987 stop:5532 length:546 start_codon:yes stop_codon:yes gene_type:complete
MTNSIPKWACADTSKSLPIIREAGETENVDFKAAFPEQGHRLAKEIAGLATKGGGRIFIGIDDNGALVGLSASNADERDDLAERAHSIALSVKPQVTVEILFAVENDLTVLVIVIPKQIEPVFYYEGRPYLRDQRRARRAEPHEVKEAVWLHPSSEQKRRLEDLTYQQQRDFLNKQRSRFS